jgi:hypothetical protein
MWMLELSMGATKVEVVACARAVQNWSESAARCAMTISTYVGKMGDHIL